MADYSIRRVNTSWNNQVTWRSSGTSAWPDGGDFTMADYGTLAINGSTSNYKHWSPTTLVTQWVSGAQPNHGLLLKQAPESTNSALAFHSSNTANSRRWPTLEVNYNDATPPAVTGAWERLFFTFTKVKLTDRMQAKGQRRQR